MAQQSAQSSPLSPSPSSPDRRVQRSRVALMAAAVRLVSGRGTTDVSVTDLTEAADVSRKLLYMHFGDRDLLLVAAARDLLEREPIPQTTDVTQALRPQILAIARHFAEHRRFYRAMLTGSCAYSMSKTIGELFGSLNKDTVRTLFPDLDPRTTDDLAVFFTGGGSAVVTTWVIDGPDPLDPEELADRMLRLASVFAPAFPFSV